MKKMQRNKINEAHLYEILMKTHEALPSAQCANHFDHLGFLPKIAMNHTVNLAKSHTDTWLRKTEK